MKSDILVDAIGMIRDETIEDAKAHTKAARFSWKKGTALAVAAVLCVMLSVPVLAAAEVESAYELFYAVAPAAAQRLQPVRRACVDNGIQMEVVSASIEGNTAELCVAMRDLEGDRIDGTIDLFDSYNIRSPYDSAGGCSFESYDEETGTAFFLVTIEQMNGRPFPSDKITFSVSEFLSGKQEYNGVLSDIELSTASASPATQTGVEVRGGSYRGRTFLKARERALSEPTKGVSVTALGLLDGKLHVQMLYQDIRKTDNHGFLCLKGKDGNLIPSADNIAFWDETRTDSYEEYIFDVPADALDEYELYGEFTTCETLVKGKWQVTFPLDGEQD